MWVSLSEGLIERGSATLAVETSIGFLLSREVGDSIVVISKEVEGEVTHVLLCRTSSMIYSTLVDFRILLTGKEIHAEGLEKCSVYTPVRG